MEKSKLKIGNIELPSNILQAPLAGYTDFMYREQCIKYGAGLCYTEMVSAKGLYYGSEKTEELLALSPLEKIKATQIFGEDAFIMGEVCKSEVLSKFDIIDINMGCPVPKLFKNGEGSALMLDLKKASEIIRECVKSGKVITVKTRLGVKKGEYTVFDFVKMAEDSGASAVTVHGRFRDDYYSGEPDFDAIAKAKSLVKIPVIANGGIFDKATCDKMVKTGVDGVMIARGSIGKPWVFSEVIGEKPNYDIKQSIIEHIDGLKRVFEDKYIAVNFRKFFPYYLKGLACKQEKIALMYCNSTDEIKDILNKIDFSQKS